MKYLIAAIAAVLCGLLAYITLDQTRTEKCRLLRPREPGEEPGKTLSEKRIRLLTAAIVLVSGLVGAYLAYRVPKTLDLIKMAVALVCMTGAACNDYREHRIPNLFPLVMACAGAVCLCVGRLTDPDHFPLYLFSSVIATVGVALCMVLASILTKHGIGYGDIKLLCALAFLCGVYTLCDTLFFGMLLCALTAIVLLAAKKKTLKGSMPFGPFLLAGFYITALAAKF